MNNYTHSFCCIDLTDVNVQIKSLSDVLNEIKTGFHAFYTHGGLISGIQNSIGGSPELLKSVFLDEYKNLQVEKMLELNERDTESSLFLIGELGSSTNAPESIQNFFQLLRQGLDSGNRFKEASSFSLNQTAVWDLFIERERYSGIIPGAHDYHEYLLWDRGDYSTKITLKEDDIWQGAGWISSRLHKISEEIEEIQIDTIETWARQGNDSLSRSLNHLTHFYQGKNPQPLNMEQHNNYIRCLCEFLPYHRSRSDNQMFIPSNSLGEKGGPMPWRGLLDDWLYLRKRHLLMDGWLTLWPDEQNDSTTLYVQPGSLALLYWAARKADMPYTDSRESFINNYDWTDPHWFGGKWKKRQVNSDG